MTNTDQPTPRPRDMFYAAVPDDFLEATIRTFDRAYRRAHEVCAENFHQQEAHDLRGHYRRAEIEQGWRSTATGFDGIAADTYLNDADNCNHTRVHCGEVVLIQCHVQSRHQIVRRALFRSGLATDSQLNLFAQDSDEVELGPDAKLFAILLHGAHPKYPDRLAFIEIAFPNNDCTGYIDSFDLLRRFPSLAKEVMPDLGTHETRPMPRLREPEQDEELRSDSDGGN